MRDPVAELVAERCRARSVRRGARLQTLWGGYGELWRFHLEGDAGAGASTVIVKEIAPPSDAARGTGEEARSHARKCRSYDVELAFYRALAARTGEGCRVPRAHAAETVGDRWLLVLEDLDAAGFTHRRRGRHAAEIEPCVRWLARFHARFLGQEPRELWPLGTYWHLATRPDELARTADAELREAAARFDHALSTARFQTLVHGDAKPANFCFSADGARVAAVDFQYVGGGCGVKDVAYLLHGTGTPAEREALLGLYFSELRASLIVRDVDGGALEDEWRRLYVVAAADFVRFLAGWSPGSYERDRDARATVEAALRCLA